MLTRSDSFCRLLAMDKIKIITRIGAKMLTRSDSFCRLLITSIGAKMLTRSDSFCRLLAMYKIKIITNFPSLVSRFSMMYFVVIL